MGYTESHIQQRKPTPPQETNPNVHKGPEICPRFKTLLALAQKLDTTHVVHIQGTPVSGKTTLALLLRDYLRPTRKVIFLSGWKRRSISMTAKEYLANVCYRSDSDGIHTHDDLLCDENSDLVFIVDDAHETYADTDFWPNVIEARLNRQLGPRFCLFTSYGLPTTEPLRKLPDGIMQKWQKWTRVALLRQRLASPEISLFYSLQEMHDVIARYNKATTGHKISENEKACIMRLTNGHPGMISAILDYVHQHVYEKKCLTPDDEISTEDILDNFGEILTSNDALEFIRYQPVGRSLPSKHMNNGVLTKPMINTLLRVLRHGSSHYESQSEVINACIISGFLFLEYEHGGKYQAKVPKMGSPDIEEFCIRVVQALPRMTLQNLYTPQCGPAGGIRTAADIFQDKFYQCCWSEAGFGGGVRRDWTRTSGVHTSLGLPEMRWRIELIYGCDDFDPSAISDRCSDLMRRGYIDDWVVLSCGKETAKFQGSCENVLHVVFNDDFSKFAVKSSGNTLSFSLRPH
ncbi:uncharacterized protein BO97DRAFT_424100 [Aspergillus homomorphus CBS 101889]|uniref:Uncharacterized protein n=1 Tax=Aspergillus homomorphus (strain CBS 101889) TaxID=1450537 RepID=A0A395HYP2_ASPHC|nr:hypothetical protein BO97DRAFT_424100 [Aspergillus homomorphus CBS 101889]RAL12920.1 hypothetical protein BO97DRAFT_424100 [Aspergillus homomorphus CBS 101889]